MESLSPLVWPALLGASALFAVSGLPSPRTGSVLAVAAAVVGLLGLVLGLTVDAAPIDVAWPVPGGRFTVALDAISAAFLLPVLLVPALGTIYGSAYMPSDQRAARRTRFAYGLLPASMIVIVLARHAFLLLVAWEVMAMAAFFLVIAYDHLPEVRESSWVYFVATHIGTLCLIAAFAILARTTGNLAIAPVVGLASPDMTAVALLFLVGFGMKAGLMPLHVWLPGAHANAPSHVSAVMSGVVLKMGVYGLVRAATVLPDLPTAMGTGLLVIGATSAVLGAALAATQADLKRLLAYSSVDNVGIIAMGLGLALIGRAEGQPELVALGIAGAVLHVWNHALFKPLLFLAAGSVIHATGTRAMDRLGGLARRLPGTDRAALVGTVALSGLPPLNGFIGELFIYVGLMRAATTLGWPAAAAPALALSGALTVVAMVKLYASVFLGTARDSGVHTHGHEAPAMTWSMGVLAGACIAVPFVAPLVVPWLGEVVGVFAPGSPVDALDIVPVDVVAAVLAGFLAVLALGGVAARAWGRRATITETGTWDCGYAAPTARMQYGGSSFSESTLRIFSRVLWPRAVPPRVSGVLPRPTAYSETLPDPVLDRAALPTFRILGRGALWLRLTQQGNLQFYLLYILLAIVALMMVR